MLRSIIKNKRGTSLIEMMVTLAIFTAIVLSATGIFQMAIEGQHNAIAGQNVQESMRYAMEVISKEIRMAQTVSAGECDAMPGGRLYRETGGNVFRFKSINDKCVVYSLDGSTQLKIKRYDISAGEASATYYPITSDDITITNLDFDFEDFATGSQQGRVTITMQAAASTGKYRSPVVLQTTISSRYYE